MIELNHVTEEVCDIKHRFLEEKLKYAEDHLNKISADMTAFQLCIGKKINRLLIVSIGILIGLVIDIIRGLFVLQNVSK